MQDRRIGGLVLVCLVIASGLIARLFSISILQHDSFLAKAQKQQIVQRDVLPRRGDVYFQNAASGKDVVVAQSVQRYSVSVTPKEVTKKAEYAHMLAGVTGTDEVSLLKIMKAGGEYTPPLQHGLNQSDMTHLADQINQLERAADPRWVDEKVDFDSSQGNILIFVGGVYFVREYERVYPEGPLAAQLLGFVNDQGKGQYGLEGEYDTALKGYSGKIAVEQDSTGTSLDQQTTVQGEDGTNYELSIDRNVQSEAEQQLAQEIKDSGSTGGTVIVMDPKTGEIMAMASNPSYDPAAFREVKQSDIGVFDNPAISNLWEPGSIFKPLVMAAAMDMGLVTPDTKNDFPESVTVDGYKIETALRKAYGVETMTQVLENSDNVAMVWVADKLGNQNMYNYLQKFGLGQSTGIDLKNEIDGNLPGVSKWSDISRSTTSFGQGVAVTPIQMVSAFGAIANGGRLVQPRMVHAIINPDGTKQPIATVEGAQVIKSQTADQLKDMMVATVEHAHNRAGTPGYKIGGKTGTAQIPDPVNGGYLPDAYNHSFVGIGPSDNPRYVMLVKLDHPDIKKVGLYAEGTAVPLFGRLSTFLLNYYQIPPTNR
ncbi:MAG: penicillin-binding protein 2 [bacterium]